jgi:hypothetical protein
MANIHIDPRPFAPHGFQIQHIAGCLGVKRVVVPWRLGYHEQYAIATFDPMHEGQIPFSNIREVLEEYLTDAARVGFRSLQPCPFGAAYVQFNNVSDRERLIVSSPNQFGDVTISFVKHNEDINWRKSQKSLRMTKGNNPDVESWTFLVEVLQQNLLGGGPLTKTLFQMMVLTHTPCQNMLCRLPLHLLPNQENEDELDGWGHWAMGAEPEQLQPMEEDVQQNIQPANQELAEEDNDAMRPPLMEERSVIIISTSSYDESGSDNSVNQGNQFVGPLLQAHDADEANVEVDMNLGLPRYGHLGEGLINILQAYLDEDEEEHILLVDNTNDHFLLPEDVDMVPPDETHLQLYVRRVQSHFFQVLEEHNLTKRFSKEGLSLWEKFFAPHVASGIDNSPVFEIPVS